MQRIYIDLGKDPHSPHAAVTGFAPPTLAGILGAPLNVAVAFFRNSEQEALAADSTGKFTLKAKGGRAGDALFTDITMTPDGDGVARVYKFEGQLLSDELIAAIGESDEIKLVGCITWIEPPVGDAEEVEERCLDFEFIVFNSAARDGDSIPATTDARWAWAKALMPEANGFTHHEDTKTISVEGGGGGGAVDSVNGQTGVVVLAKADIGLGNVDNTSDANKPISNQTQAALNAKANQVDMSTVEGDVASHQSDINALNAHAASTANPHSVTKAQVGLENVTDDAQLKAADLDTDETMAANSDTKIASQKAVKTAIANAVTGLLDFKGATDASANPNYPAASKSDAYVISVAGKIGGASGKTVAVGDFVVAIADNAGGTEASVGTSWIVLESNITGTSAGLAMLQAANAAAQTALLSTVVGDSGSGGTKGMVPAPAAGDAAAGKFLKANGAWAVPAGGGGGGLTWAVKTSAYTAAAGDTLIANTSAGGFTITLPASPSDGDVVQIIPGNDWAGLALTLDAGANSIGDGMVSVASLTFNVAASLVLVFKAASGEWRLTAHLASGYMLVDPTNGFVRRVYVSGSDLTMEDGVNLAFNTSTGTKIGTATGQKLAFWNASPIAQPGAMSNVGSTFSVSGGDTVSQANVEAALNLLGGRLDDVLALLRSLGLMAP